MAPPPRFGELVESIEEPRSRCEWRRRAGGRACASRRPTLADRDVMSRVGIPVNGLVQTLCDLPAALAPRAVEGFVKEAYRLDLIAPPALRKDLEAHPCEPGVKPLRIL